MKHITQKGFTLIEMLAVLGIFAVLTSIVVFNYSRFRSETILTNMAYEVALSIREAQIYGVSARNAKGIATPDFTLPYGIYFIKNSNQYFLFADTDGSNNQKFDGTDCINTGGDTCVTPYTMQQNIQVTDLKYLDALCVSTDSASVLFKRPNPEPIVSNDSNRVNYSIVQVTLSSPDGDIRYVAVYNNGQVAVLNEPIQGCN